jgi:hypothetical protein
MFKQIKQLEFNSVLVQTETQESLCKAFLRFQEYYESPKFKGQIFTLGQVKHWYSITYGADTYYRDWEGFNFPSHVLEPFKKGLFDPLTTEEQALLDLFKYRSDIFYVIGANNTNVTRHELAHALYSFDPKYKSAIDKLCRTNKSELKSVTKYLLDKGYDKSVINDELQAYITDNEDTFIIANLSHGLIHQFNSIQKRYWDVNSTSRKTTK